MKLIRSYIGTNFHMFRRSSRYTNLQNVTYRNAFTQAIGQPEMEIDKIKEIAQMSPTQMSLQQMKTFANGGHHVRLVAAKFLHQELQIRFARAILELQDLPIGLSKTASVRRAITFYAQQLQLIHTIKPPVTIEDDFAFTTLLRQTKRGGENLVPLICQGIRELKATDLGQSLLRMDNVADDVQDRLDKFFLARIGIRMLIGQHVESLHRIGGRVALLDVEKVVRGACEDAAGLCVRYIGECPEVKIRSTIQTTQHPFMYVNSHLHHMVFEIVKNSMRATIEFHRNLQKNGKPPPPPKSFTKPMTPRVNFLGFDIPSPDEVSGVTINPDIGKYRRQENFIPPIQIVLCQGQEDLTIRISDEGGGVPRSQWSTLWHYDSTTSAMYPPNAEDHSFRNQFSGGGYGLPIARLFARYFGGEVTFISLEGSGSSVFIQLNRLGTKTEMVPGHASFSLQPLYYS